MHLLLGIPTLKRFDTLEKCIKSALAGTKIPDLILIIDNSGGKLKNEAWFDEMKDHPRLSVIESPWNFGVASSWNTILAYTNDIALISNDDIEFGETTIEDFYNEFTRKNLNFLCDSKAGLAGFSLFMINPYLVFEKVGLFDPQFWPAYFEDNDYAYRMKLVNEPMSMLDTQFSHFGSATVASYNEAENTEHVKTFLANRDYYIKKWGGLPGEELYTSPFNKEITTDGSVQTSGL